MENITFIINGLIKKVPDLIQNIQLAFSEDFNVTFKVTQNREDAITYAENSVLENSKYIIAVGGDGTLHEVINGIMHVPKSRREKIVAGILPTGSGNDFAKTLKIKADINFLKQLIDNKENITIDIGKVNVIDLENKNSTKYFVNIAEVVKKIKNGKKILNPTLNFFVATVSSFLTYRKRKIKLISENFSYSGDILVLCFANGKYFGSGLQIAPHAIVNDGKLALFLAGDVSLFDYLKNLSKIRKGSFIRHSNIQYSEINSAFVESIDDGLLVEADGELLGKLPAKFEILKNELRFLA